jgi:Fe-S cluster biogenesis protein NfuA
MTKKKDVEKRVKEILEEEIKPAVAMDGGDVDFVSYKDGIVSVKLKGACHGCPGAMMTLKFGIENRLKEEIPEVIEVVAV